MRYLRSMPNKELAKRLGVHPTTVSRWRGVPPEWAAKHIATLRGLEEVLWAEPLSTPSTVGSSATGSSATTDDVPLRLEWDEPHDR